MTDTPAVWPAAARAARAASAERRVLDRIVGWATAEPNVRAVLLNGSRANPKARVDRLSDYDLEVAVSDTRPFAGDESWLRWYGTPIALFRDGGDEDGFQTIARLVLYEDDTRIDYSVYPAPLLAKVASAPELPRGLDLGYRVLVDKDDLTTRLAAPTHTANVPRAPTEAQFLEVVEEFWWGLTYVAKFLWRDELFFAYTSLSSGRNRLLRLLEWRAEIEHGWSLPLWVRGREMKRRLDPARWTEVERTFAGAGIEDNWRALFALTELFGRVAANVAAGLNFAYPRDLEQRVTDYLRRIRALPAGGGEEL